MMAPGNDHNNKVKMAKRFPPSLSPIVVIVWVVEGPGRALQKALISINSSCEMNFKRSTKFLLK